MKTARTQHASRAGSLGHLGAGSPTDRRRTNRRTDGRRDPEDILPDALANLQEDPKKPTQADQLVGWSATWSVT